MKVATAKINGYTWAVSVDGAPVGELSKCGYRYTFSLGSRERIFVGESIKDARLRIAKIMQARTSVPA